MTSKSNKRFTNLHYGDRWLRDGLEVCGRAGHLQSLEVDMSIAQQTVTHWRAKGVRVTYTHLIVRAVARVLAVHPEWHVLIAGNRHWHPDQVNIGLSISSETFVTPTLILEDAGKKDLSQIANEVAAKAPEVVREHERMIAESRRWGWLVPFAFLRRAIMRTLFQRVWFGSAKAATFQVSCLPTVDDFYPLLFNTAGALGIGAVRERVIVKEGRSMVRPTVRLCCAADHSVWNGMTCSAFLNALKEELELDHEQEESTSEPSRKGKQRRTLEGLHQKASMAPAFTSKR